jgi:hypothetical protein
MGEDVSLVTVMRDQAEKAVKHAEGVVATSEKMSNAFNSTVLSVLGAILSNQAFVLSGVSADMAIRNIDMEVIKKVIAETLRTVRSGASTKVLDYDRVMAHTLAALRYTQAEDNWYKCMHHFEEVTPLTFDEIDSLCEDLNCGELAIVYDKSPEGADEDPTEAGHAGDCTIYAALINGQPSNGVCTCGYGHYMWRKGHIEHMFSEDRLNKPMCICDKDPGIPGPDTTPDGSIHGTKFVC